MFRLGTGGLSSPFPNVDVTDSHEQVTLKTSGISLYDWQKRFDRIMNKIHEKTALYSSEEIESDIIQAVNEVREEKNGC